MQIRVKQKSNESRHETKGKLIEVLINEDILNPDRESVSLCFRGKESSGIIDLSPSEIALLFDTVKSKLPLIKELKTLSGGGAELL